MPEKKWALVHPAIGRATHDNNFAFDCERIIVSNVFALNTFCWHDPDETFEDLATGQTWTLREAFPETADA